VAGRKSDSVTKRGSPLRDSLAVSMAPGYSHRAWTVPAAVETTHRLEQTARLLSDFMSECDITDFCHLAEQFKQMSLLH